MANSVQCSTPSNNGKMVEALRSMGFQRFSINNKMFKGNHKELLTKITCSTIGLPKMTKSLDSSKIAFWLDSTYIDETIKADRNKNRRRIPDGSGFAIQWVNNRGEDMFIFGYAYWNENLWKDVEDGQIIVDRFSLAYNAYTGEMMSEYEFDKSNQPNWKEFIYSSSQDLDKFLFEEHLKSFFGSNGTIEKVEPRARKRS